jgi:hypothetical protein
MNYEKKIHDKCELQELNNKRNCLYSYNVQDMKNPIKETVGLHVMQ